MATDELFHHHPEPYLAETTMDVPEMKDILRASVEAKTNHRKLQTATWRRYAESMKAGTWEWTDASPIRLHKHGAAWVCSDGQHRLAAAVHVGVPLRTWVLYNAPAGIHTDRGLARTDTQWLQSMGYTDPSALAGASRHVLTMRGRGRIPHGQYRTRNLQSEDVVAFVARRDIAADMERMHVRGFARIGTLAARMVLRDIDPELCERFWDQLVDPPVDPSPFGVLREWASRNFVATGKTMPTPKSYAAVVRCWSHDLNGTTPSGYRITGKAEDLWRLPVGYPGTPGAQPDVNL